MEEEKKVNEELNEVEETEEEVAAPAVVPEESKTKKFHLFKTKEEKDQEWIAKHERKSLKEALKAQHKRCPDDQGCTEALTQMNHEDLISLGKKAAGIFTGVVAGGAAVLGVYRVLHGHGDNDNTVDTTFEEVSTEETSSEE